MRSICTAVVAMLALAGMSFAATINVPGDYPTIQSALSAASDGDEIVLAPGTYILVQGGISITKSITLRSSEGNSKTFVTANPNGLNYGHLRFDGTSSSGSLVEGITFDSFPLASTIIRFEGNTNCTVRSCRFINSPGGGNQSVLFNGHNVERNGRVEDCLFANTSADGTSVFSGIAADEIQLVVNSCHFESNNGGRGIRVHNSYAQIYNCSFTNNSAGDQGGGGIRWNGCGGLHVENCAFESNTAGSGGGAILTYSDNDGEACGLDLAGSTITNCLFAENSATEMGGAIFNYLGSAENMIVSESTFCLNSPDDIDGGWTDGGGNGFYDFCDDQDGDGVADGKDNCYLYNPDQADCNENGIGDVCDVADGTSEDINSSGIPDECECMSDIDTSGEVDISDVLTVIAQWGNAGPLGDVNYDGIVNTDDLLAVLSVWGPCP
jgi:predicted outer membrane repeat protein